MAEAKAAAGREERDVPPADAEPKAAPKAAAHPRQGTMTREEEEAQRNTRERAGVQGNAGVLGMREEEPVALEESDILRVLENWAKSDDYRKSVTYIMRCMKEQHREVAKRQKDDALFISTIKNLYNKWYNDERQIPVARREQADELEATRVDRQHKKREKKKEKKRKHGVEPADDRSVSGMLSEHSDFGLADDAARDEREPRRSRSPSRPPDSVMGQIGQLRKQNEKLYAQSRDLKERMQQQNSRIAALERTVETIQDPEADRLEAEGPSPKRESHGGPKEKLEPLATTISS